MNKVQTSAFIKLSDFLRGRTEGLRPLVWGIVWKAQRFVQGIRMTLSGTFTRPDDGRSRPPDAGKPSPLMPSPTHHLAAAKALPPSDETYLFPID
jgi:hypothetical protein